MLTSPSDRAANYVNAFIKGGCRFSDAAAEDVMFQSYLRSDQPALVHVAILLSANSKTYAPRALEALQQTGNEALPILRGTISDETKAMLNTLRGDFSHLMTVAHSAEREALMNQYVTLSTAYTGLAKTHSAVPFSTKPNRVPPMSKAAKDLAVAGYFTSLRD